MTLKEFLEKNPEAIKEASKCKDIKEFKDLTEKAGITFDSDEKLSKAFDLVKNQNSMELTDDALNAVSGGKVYEYAHEEVAFNPRGDALAFGAGKKVK